MCTPQFQSNLTCFISSYDTCFEQCFAWIVRVENLNMTKYEVKKAILCGLSSLCPRMECSSTLCFELAWWKRRSRWWCKHRVQFTMCVCFSMQRGAAHTLHQNKLILASIWNPLEGVWALMAPCSGRLSGARDGTFEGRSSTVPHLVDQNYRFMRDNDARSVGR